jgi:hypothetical protein
MIGSGGRMRILLLVPLTVAAVGAAACRSPSRDPEATAFQVPQRDLTLQQADAPQVDVASPVELDRAVPVERHTVIRPQKARQAARSAALSSPAEPATADVPVSTPAPGAAAVPASPASYEPPDPYALAPGQTVTVLPASSGSAPAPSSTDNRPPDAQRGPSRGVTIRGGGDGGSCGGRGGHPRGGGPGFRGLR